MTQSTDTMLMFLNGTAMSGFADHVHVQGSKFLGPRRTVARYRFYAVRDEYPGLVEVESRGVAILGELYEMERLVFEEQLLPNEPRELRRGEVDLEDGTRSHVMILDLDRVPSTDRLVDIGSFGGWRAYVDYLAAEIANNDVNRTLRQES
jgi:gamma-glutamylcyclotransferase (GGCT)/AIG2-like uncharacterized protein YtfP